jgi:hypothetical protein
MVRDLLGHHPPPHRMLQLKNPPWFARDDLVMTHPHYKHVGPHRNANRYLAALLVSPAWGLA